MSKRTQTTGVPKRRRRRSAAAEDVASSAQRPGDPDFTSRAEQEARLQKLVVRGVIALIAVLIVAVGAAFAVEQLIIPNQVVATVNGEEITVQQFRDEYILERTRLSLQLNQLQSAGFDLQQLSQQEPYSTWISEVNVPDQLGLRVINDMVDNLLVAQEAARRDIQVDGDAVQKEIEAYFGFDPTEVALIGVEPTASPEPTITPTPFVSPTPTSIPTATLTPTPSDAEEPAEDTEPTVTPQPTVVEPTLSAEEVRENFATRQEDYRNYFSINDVASDKLDTFFERLALEALLTDALVNQEDGLLFADVRHILLDEEEQALAALEALQNGESFADLARANSTDTGSGFGGGELGEAFVGNYVREFRDAIESAEVGALVGPVESEFGYHILQVRSKEWRAGDEIASQLERAKQVEFDRLVDSLREQNSDSLEIFDSWLNHIPRR